MEVKQPLVTVIVPNYNHEKYLEQRLESIFNQTYSNYEVILMDDCSTDNSLSVLNKYKNHKKVTASVFNKTNTGNTFKQWAKGISIAKGELLWIAESDDYCENNFLEELVKPFQNDSQIVLAYCQSKRVNEFGEITGNWITHTNDLDANLFSNDFSMNGNTFIEKYLINKNVIPNASAVLFRKSTVDIVKYIDITPEFRTCGDWMFYFKLIINKKIYFHSNSLNSFRYHSKSVIAQTKGNQNKIELIDIDIRMRKNIIDYLKHKVILNFEKIKEKNKDIVRNFLIYEKALLLLQTGDYVRGRVLLFSVLDIYFKRKNFKKRIEQKLKKIYNSIFNK